MVALTQKQPEMEAFFKLTESPNHIVQVLKTLPKGLVGLNADESLPKAEPARQQYIFYFVFRLNFARPPYVFKFYPETPRF